MSEFAGIVTFGRSDLARACLPSLVDQLDGACAAQEQVHITDDGAFAFRQRVLSFEDRFERQPSVGAASGIVSMFDGRLDNRTELIEALGLTNRSNEPVPDGTIARAAYEQWGEGAPDRLLGDFAWAIWDEREGKLVLSRDHSIQRALFFCQTESFIAFSTEYAPLLALPGVSKEPDPLTIARMLIAAPSLDSHTLFESIRWVGSSTCVTLTRDAVRERRFWVPAERDILRLRSDDDYIDAARSVFDKAVADRLRIEGPLVASISGGLDSSAVAATAARLSAPSAVRALCMVPRPDSAVRDTRWRYASEAPLVDQIAAQHVNLEVEYLDQGYGDTDAVSLVPRLGQPLRGPGNFLWFSSLNRRAVALGANVILHGSFGNYTFSATGENEPGALQRTGDFAGLARLLVTPGHSERTARRLLRSVFPRRTPSDYRSALAFAPINPDFARDLAVEEVFQRESIVRQKPDGGEPRARILRNVVMRSRLQVEARAAQRRIFGLTAADPFADRRVIDFCLSLPSNQFNRAGENRRLARRAFSDRLPDAVLRNRRRGIQDPEWHWRLLTERDRIEAILDRFDRSDAVGRVLDIRRVRSLLRALPNDPEAAAHHRLQAQSLEMALQIGAFLAWVEGGMARADNPAAA